MLSSPRTNVAHIFCPILFYFLTLYVLFVNEHRKGQHTSSCWTSKGTTHVVAVSQQFHVQTGKVVYTRPETASIYMICFFVQQKVLAGNPI